MSGYFARVVALALGGSGALRPAPATRYGAPAFAGSAAEPPAEIESISRGAPARTHDRARESENEPVRAHDDVRFGALQRLGPADAGDERNEAQRTVRASPPRSVTGDEPHDASGERALEHGPPHANDTALAAPPSRRLLPLGLTAEDAALQPLVRSAPQQRDGAPAATGRAERRSGAAAERRAAAHANEAADVYVRIGRIDVRAVTVPERRAATESRTALRKPTLEAHLRARDGGHA